MVNKTCLWSLLHCRKPGLTEDGIRVSLTEISLAPQEFDDYQIGVDVAVTFCLKELRVLHSGSDTNYSNDFAVCYM